MHKMFDMSPNQVIADAGLDAGMLEAFGNSAVFIYRSFSD